MNLLPPNASTELRAFEETLEQQLVKLQGISLDLNPLTCKEELLPHLAFLYSLDISSLSVEEQRQYVRNAFEIRRYAGTPYSMKKTFESFNIDASLEEWFDYEGEPYHFKVSLSMRDKEITLSLANKLRGRINETKNIRSVLDELILSYMQSQKVVVASGGVGEVSIHTEMLEGYEETLKGLQKINIGAVGEVVSYAKMEVKKW
jgi:phage tail P2-like protein